MKKQLNQEKKLRLLFNTNAPWASSGYANQAREFLPLISREGYPTACVGFYGLEGGKIALDNVLFYPRMGDVWGADAMVDHSTDFQADITFSLQDIWVLNPELLKRIKRWIPIVPIDHEPVPAAIYQRLKMAYRIVTYSQFGKRELERNGLHSTYIPHTVDTDAIKPMGKKELYKKKLGIEPDVYLFGMVAANKDNPPRKSFQEAMDAFFEFQKVHDKSAMYFHTLLKQQGGFDIEDYANFLGIRHKVFALPPYVQMYKVDKYGMNDIYNAMDCLLAPSTNEGFGIPIIEAQAAGVPVITNRFTAMPELVVEGKTGFICEVATKRFTPLGSYIGIPDTKSIYKQMEAVYKADRNKMSTEARSWIMENYDTKRVFQEKWKPYLQLLQDEIYPPAGLTK